MNTTCQRTPGGDGGPDYGHKSGHKNLMELSLYLSSVQWDGRKEVWGEIKNEASSPDLIPFYFVLFLCTQGSLLEGVGGPSGMGSPVQGKVPYPLHFASTLPPLCLRAQI